MDTSLSANFRDFEKSAWVGAIVHDGETTHVNSIGEVARDALDAFLASAPAGTYLAFTALQARLFYERGGWVWVDPATMQPRWPERYYAEYRTTAPQPTPVIRWLDTWLEPNYRGIPPKEDLIPVTVDEWDDKDFHKLAGKGVQNGKIIDYTPTAVDPDLVAQAITALDKFRAELFRRIASYNFDIPPECVAYQKQLLDIISGVNAQAATLPVAPALSSLTPPHPS